MRDGKAKKNSITCSEWKAIHQPGSRTSYFASHKRFVVPVWLRVLLYMLPSQDSFLAPRTNSQLL